MAGVRLVLLMVCVCVCGASWGGQQRYSLYAGSREQGHTGDGARAASRHRYTKLICIFISIHSLIIHTYIHKVLSV